MPNKFRKQGNIAYSECDIENYDVPNMKAFSKYGNSQVIDGTVVKNANGESVITNIQEGWSSNVKRPIFEEFVKSVGDFFRFNDTEYKLVENIAEKIGYDVNAKGKVTIVSEKPVCDSCQNVIKAFSKMFSNLEIYVYDSNGGVYVIKGGEIH